MKTLVRILGSDFDVLDRIEDLLSANYVDGEDYELHYAMGDDYAHAISLKNEEIREDFELRDLINESISEDDIEDFGEQEYEDYWE